MGAIVIKFWPLFVAMFFCVACTAVSAQQLTWGEANKRSATLYNEAEVEQNHKKLIQAADLAALAVNLYPVQSSAYSSSNHMQLLENAQVLILEANGAMELIDFFRKTEKQLEKISLKDRSVQVVVERQLAQLYRRSLDFRKSDRYYKNAFAHASDNFGKSSPLAITLLMEWATVSRFIYGNSWAKERLQTAKELAQSRGVDSDLELRIDLVLSQIVLDEKPDEKGIAEFRGLIEKLENRSGVDPALLQQSILRLAYAYEEIGDEANFNKTMGHLDQTYAGDTKGVTPAVRVEPIYPRSALRRRQGGYVALQFTVNEKGKPVDIQVLDSNADRSLQKAAVEAVEKWLYRPAKKDGKTVRTEGVRTQLIFRLR